MSGTKPGIDHLKVGDEVVVIQKVHRSEDRLIPARITKTNRVWWEFEEILTGREVRLRPRTWRMRKTTQCEGDYRGDRYGDRFVTAEQLAWEDREKAADRYLSEIRIRFWECLIPKERLSKVDLANMIRKHLDLEEI